MSSFENVIGGKLKLKGKALYGKVGGVKKKKKHKHHHDDHSQIMRTELQEEGSYALSSDTPGDIVEADKLGEDNRVEYDDYLIPAERRYIKQREKIDMKRLAKMVNKSHRDRIQEFNQYLANLSEHYDIPKVGPG